MTAAADPCRRDDPQDARRQASALARFSGVIGDGRHPLLLAAPTLSEEPDGSRSLGAGRRRLVRVPAAERRVGRLYAVRCAPDAAGDNAPREGDGNDAAGVVLELLAGGEARTLPQKVRPPAGVRAIALATGVWAAPMDDDVHARRPSQHPERRRAHLTVVVGVEGESDGVDVSVLRYGDGSPTVLRGGVGLIHQRMLRCWSRRPEAPWASMRSSGSVA